MSDEVLEQELAMEAHDSELASSFSMDLAESKLSEWAKSHPSTHRFTPGLYTREIFMPAGTIATTKIHKTEHPFVISQGEVSVYIEGSDKVERFTAPHTGITKPGTRRLLFVHKDTTWTTFHPTNETDLGVIEDQIIEPYINPFLADEKVIKELTE